MFEITRCDSRTAIDTCKEARLPAEHGRPLLEVRHRGDGHPPVTERERVIRLNGIGGVTFKTPIENSIRVLLYITSHPDRSAANSKDPEALPQRTDTEFLGIARNEHAINDTAEPE